MQKLAIAALGAASLFAVPAFAQSTTSGTQANHGSSTATQNQPNGQNLTQAQLKITQDLQKDGYKDVRVVPNSFLVHAQNKEGMPVVMIINPDSVFAMTEMGSNGTGSPNGSGNASHGSLGANPNPNTPTSKQ